MASATLPAIKESEFQNQVLELARIFGWEKRYHPWLAVKSDPGWPDLALCRPGRDGISGRLILAEVKSQKGQVTVAQAESIEALSTVKTAPDVYLWRPGQWDEIVRVLRS